eukprot:11323197-Ditylum_brightwellii.AAC.1
MDGLKLYLQEVGNVEIQEWFYNGWKHDHYVSNVFAFTPNGMFLFMVINLPGDTHDSTAASQGFIYKQIEQFYNIYGGRFVIDSAFSAICSDYLAKLSQHDTTSTNAFEMLQNKKAISVRQMAEWGMQGFQ